MSEKRDVSRADAVRARRAQRSAKELEQTTKRAVKPVKLTNTISARVDTSQMVGKRVDKLRRADSTRRRFNVALGLPHITLHNPTSQVARPFGTWRRVSLIIALLLGTALYLAWTLPYFHIPAATILGNNRLSREEINMVLGVTGQSVFLVQPEDVATRLRLNYPELASAQVNVYLPNHVYVTVTERQPVILWQQGEGFTWIDASGVAFRPRGDASGLIPVIGLATPPVGNASLDDSLSPPAYMQKELVDAILVLAPSVPAGSTLTFDPADGLGWTDARGWKAYFGLSAQDMPLKVRVYQSLVDSLISRNKTPEYINVAYPDAPYYRMAEQPSTEFEPAIEDGQ